MIKKITFLSLFSILVLNCEKEKILDANDIINKSIKISGGEYIRNATIDFDFRNIHYTAIRNNGVFKLGRRFVKEQDTILDWLSNDAFERTINNQPVKLLDEMIPRYSSSVNSVHYFSVLPYGLHVPAVNKFYINEVQIKGKAYYKVKVTFNKEGGGEDFEDVFFYYVNTKTFKVEYLSYSYAEAHGVGLRFREAYNERYVNGVRFVDYNNYKLKKKMLC